jgi:hypothetical protein
LKLNIQKSRLLSWFVGCTHAGAMLMVLALPPGIGLKPILLGLVAASLVRERRRAQRASGSSAELSDRGEWRQADGRRYRVTRAMHDPFAVRLSLEDDDGRRRRILVMRDAVDSRAYHALCSRIAQRRLPHAETRP